LTKYVLGFIGCIILAKGSAYDSQGLGKRLDSSPKLTKEKGQKEDTTNLTASLKEG
jgi:hypothetical protein